MTIELIIERWKRGLVIGALFVLVAALSLLIAAVPIMALASLLGKSSDWGWSGTAIAALIIAPFLFGGTPFNRAIRAITPPGR